MPAGEPRRPSVLAAARAVIRVALVSVAELGFGCIEGGSDTALDRNALPKIACKREWLAQHTGAAAGATARAAARYGDRGLAPSALQAAACRNEEALDLNRVARRPEAHHKASADAREYLHPHAVRPQSRHHRSYVLLRPERVE